MDERDWTDQPIQPGQKIERAGCTIALAPPQHIAFVSGPLEAAMSHLLPGADILSLCATPQSKDYAIRIGRDHAVLVTRAAFDRASGFQPEGFALSLADDRYAAITLTGPGARDVLNQGLQDVLPDASPSCALHFAHRPVLLTGRADGFTLWVDPTDLTYLTTFFEGMNHD